MSFNSFKDKYKLPDQLKVEIHKSKHGFTANLPEYPGCLTFAESISELVENVNDALLTYLDVPRDEATKIDFLYVPKDKKRVKVQEEIKQSKPAIGFSNFFPVSPQFSYV